MLSLLGDGTAPVPAPALPLDPDGGLDGRDFDSKKLMEAETDAERGTAGTPCRGGVAAPAASAAEVRLGGAAGLSLISFSRSKCWYWAKALDPYLIIQCFQVSTWTIRQRRCDSSSGFAEICDVKKGGRWFGAKWGVVAWMLLDPSGSNSVSKVEAVVVVVVVIAVDATLSAQDSDRDYPCLIDSAYGNYLAL